MSLPDEKATYPGAERHGYGVYEGRAQGEPPCRASDRSQRQTPAEEPVGAGTAEGSPTGQGAQ